MKLTIRFFFRGIISIIVSLDLLILVNIILALVKFAGDDLDADNITYLKELVTFHTDDLHSGTLSITNHRFMTSAHIDHMVSATQFIGVYSGNDLKIFDDIFTTKFASSTNIFYPFGIFQNVFISKKIIQKTRALSKDTNSNLEYIKNNSDKINVKYNFNRDIDLELESEEKLIKKVHDRYERDKVYTTKITYLGRLTDNSKDSARFLVMIENPEANLTLGSSGSPMVNDRNQILAFLSGGYDFLEFEIYNEMFKLFEKYEIASEFTYDVNAKDEFKIFNDKNSITYLRAEKYKDLIQTAYTNNAHLELYKVLKEKKDLKRREVLISEFLDKIYHEGLKNAKSEMSIDLYKYLEINDKDIKKNLNAGKQLSIFSSYDQETISKLVDNSILYR